MPRKPKSNKENPAITAAKITAIAAILVAIIALISPFSERIANKLLENTNMFSPTITSSITSTSKMETLTATALAITLMPTVTETMVPIPATSMPITDTPITTIQAETSCINWEFDNQGDTEGWYIGRNVERLTAHDGSLFMEIVGGDARILSRGGLSIDASVITRLLIRYRIDAADDYGQLVWESVEFPDLGGNYQWVDFGVFTDNNWQVLNFNLTNYTRPTDETTRWSGIITQLRLDPVKYAAVRRRNIWDTKVNLLR